MTSKLKLVSGEGEAKYKLDDGPILVPTETGLKLAGSVKDIDTLSGNPYHDPSTGKFSNSPFGWLKKLGQAADILGHLDKASVKQASQAPGFGAALKNADGIFARNNDDGSVTIALVNGSQVLHASDVGAHGELSSATVPAGTPMSKDVDHARLEKMIQSAPDASAPFEMPENTHSKLGSSIQALLSEIGAEGKGADEALDAFYGSAYSAITGQEKPRGRFRIVEDDDNPTVATYRPGSGNIDIDQDAVKSLISASDKWAAGKDLDQVELGTINVLIHEVGHSTKDLDAQYMMQTKYAVGEGKWKFPTLTHSLEEGSNDALALWRAEHALSSLGMTASKRPNYDEETDWIRTEFLAPMEKALGDRDAAYEALARVHHDSGWGTMWVARLNAELSAAGSKHEINPWTAPNAGVDPSYFRTLSDDVDKADVIVGLSELPKGELDAEVEWARDHGSRFQYSAAVEAQRYQGDGELGQGFAAPLTHFFGHVNWPKKDSELTVINKNLGGSTGAKLVEGKDGSKFVLKGGKTPEHIRDELAADAVYQALGIDVPPIAVTEKGEKLAVYLNGSQYSSISNPTMKEKARTEIRKGFVADALLGNWDVIGLSGDNVMMLSNGKPVRIDNGGALRYRGMGEKKPDKFVMAPVSEIWTMRGKDPKVSNSTAADVFGEMSFKDVADQIIDVSEKKHDVINAIPDKKLREIVEHRMKSIEFFDDVIIQARAEDFSYEEIDKALQEAVSKADGDLEKLESYGKMLVYDHVKGGGLQEGQKPDPQVEENISDPEYQGLWTPGEGDHTAPEMLKVGMQIEWKGSTYTVTGTEHGMSPSDPVHVAVKDSVGEPGVITMSKGQAVQLSPTKSNIAALLKAETIPEQKTLLAKMDAPELWEAWKSDISDQSLKNLIFGYYSRKEGASPEAFKEFLKTNHPKKKWLDFFKGLNEEQLKLALVKLATKHYIEDKKTVKVFETWAEAVTYRAETYHETDLLANLSKDLDELATGISTKLNFIYAVPKKLIDDYAEKDQTPQAVKDLAKINKDVVEFPDNFDDLKQALKENIDKLKVNDLPVGSIYGFKTLEAVAKKIDDDKTVLYWKNGQVEDLVAPQNIMPPTVALPNKYEEIPDDYKGAKKFLHPNDSLTTIEELPNGSIFNVKQSVVKKITAQKYELMSADGSKKSLTPEHLTAMNAPPYTKAPTKIAIPGDKKPEHKQTVKKKHVKKLETIVSPLELDKFGYQASTPKFWYGHSNNVKQWPKGAKSTVKQYGGSWHSNINQHLRGVHEGGSDIKKMIRRMDGAFEEVSPLEQPITVFRGVSGGTGGGIAGSWFKEVKNAQIGEEFIDHGFLSTSKKFSTANDFGSVVEVRVPTGARVIDMQDSAVEAPHAGEHEVIIGRGAKFVYLGVNGNGIPVVFLKGYDRKDPDSYTKVSANPAAVKMTYPEMKQNIADQVNAWTPSAGTDFKGHAAALLAVHDVPTLDGGKVEDIVKKYSGDKDPEEYLTWLKVEEKNTPSMSFESLIGMEYGGTEEETDVAMKKFKVELAKLPLEKRGPLLEKLERLKGYPDRKGSKQGWKTRSKKIQEILDTYSKDTPIEEIELQPETQAEMIALLKPNTEHLTLKQLPVGSIFGKGPGHSVAKKSGSNSIDVWMHGSHYHTKQPNSLSLVPDKVFIPPSAQPKEKLPKSTTKLLSGLVEEKNLNPAKIENLFSLSTEKQKSYIKTLKAKEFDTALDIALAAPVTNIALLHVFEARAFQMKQAHGGASWGDRLIRIQNAIQKAEKGKQ